jgi:zinc protease
VVVHRPAKLPYLVLGYKAPVIGHAGEDWEPYALRVLAGILDAGDSARLPARLVRGAELAAAAGASYDLYDRLPGLFVLSAIPTPGTEVAELEAALHREVRALREAPVAADELARVKRQVVASEVYQRDSLFYQAMRLGRLATVGLDWRLHEDYVDRIRAVTPEQVREVARRYLVPARLTVAELRPEPLDGPAVAAAPEAR